ncbi:MAG: preprotein translocase subunit SecA [Gammaproteobacteria bacterium]|nr:preprotein translocase subunit SecA [Gammaproteobacteria bacterium]
MISKLGKVLFGSRNERLVKRIQKIANQVGALEVEYEALSDEELKKKTESFRQRLDNQETEEDILIEAFATVREASKRVLGMRHFDVQLIGGMVLHQGKIAEMKTGEGKTLVATLAVYLNALEGKGVHVVTVNDYLAKRDAEWMGKLYAYLGLTTGVIVPGLNQEERRSAYQSDITYGTNNEFGFDYLRDNMVLSTEEKVQRGLHFAIVDEVDSILIDEARTPLIISGPSNENSELYKRVDVVIPNLQQAVEDGSEGDFTVDEKSKQVFLTESGHDHVESLLVEHGLLAEGESLYDTQHISLLHHVNAALRAHVLYHKNDEYIVRDGEVIIVDEFTGRTMPGRRWSDGLHQAVEAKEGVQIQQESQTLASITFQNYFRLYEKLAGMTGTADTEAYEFQQIYGLEVVAIPTHKQMAREDRADLVFLTVREKFDAVCEDIEDCHKRGQPVLVGTTSIEVSEYIANLLKDKKVPHEVLNAKQHEREANIVENAGLPGGVTIATNMAGRGTDIQLGGNLDAQIRALGDDATEAKIDEVRAIWKERHEQVLAAGGLHIVGTERHESRRIDNQLRGRSGRQGDPGSSRFYLSLEDNLMRIFASERVSSLMQKLGMEEGEAIEHPWVTKAIENAQRKVEAHNFDMRKHLLEYDDIANDQRKIIYEQRDEVIASEDISETITEMRKSVVKDVMSTHIPPDSMDEMWDIPAAQEAIEKEFGEACDLQAWLDADDDLDESGLYERVTKQLADSYQAKEALAGSEALRHFEKMIVLKVLDEQWKEHLAAMDYLRQSIGLRGYAQKNPKQEYKRESFDLFRNMLDDFRLEVIRFLSKVQVQSQEAVEALEKEQKPPAQAMDFQHEAAPSAFEDTPLASPQNQAQHSEESEQPFVRETPKVGRNEPCPCGSGKKYKQCHGRLQ